MPAPPKEHQSSELLSIPVGQPLIVAWHQHEPDQLYYGCGLLDRSSGEPEGTE